MKTERCDKKFHRSAGGKRPQSVNRHPVKLAEVINEQAGDKQQIRRSASFLQLIQARDRSQHQGVIVEAMVAHQQFEHDQDRENRERPRDQSFLAPTDEHKQSGKREEYRIGKAIANMRILNQASEKCLKVEKARRVRLVRTRKVCISSRLHRQLEVGREMPQVGERR